MKGDFAKIVIAVAIPVVLYLAVTSICAYVDIQKCICSALTSEEKSFPIDARLYRVYEKKTMQSGAFIFIRTVCDHGRRIQLIVMPDEGIIKGHIVTD